MRMFSSSSADESQATMSQEAGATGSFKSVRAIFNIIIQIPYQSALIVLSINYNSILTCKRLLVIVIALIIFSTTLYHHSCQHKYLHLSIQINLTLSSRILT